MSMWNHVEDALYKNIFGKNEVNQQSFSLLDAWQFFIECAQENPMVQYCALAIERKGDQYLITQAMMREVSDEYKVIRLDRENAMARQVYAYNLSNDLIEYMGGKNLRMMDLRVLSAQTKEGI